MVPDVSLDRGVFFLEKMARRINATTHPFPDLVRRDNFVQTPDDKCQWCRHACVALVAVV